VNHAPPISGTPFESHQASAGMICNTDIDQADFHGNSKRPDPREI